MEQPIEYDSSAPEKDPNAGGHGVPQYDEEKKHSISRARHASMSESIVAADLLDERYLQTQRGLKSRHAQMIALGGTIGI